MSSFCLVINSRLHVISVWLFIIPRGKLGVCEVDNSGKMLVVKDVVDGARGDTPERRKLSPSYFCNGWTVDTVRESDD